MNGTTMTITTAYAPITVVHDDGAEMNDKQLAVTLYPYLEDLMVRTNDASDGEPEDVVIRRGRMAGNYFFGVVIDTFGEERGRRIARMALAIITGKLQAERESEQERERELVAV